MFRYFCFILLLISTEIFAQENAIFKGVVKDIDNKTLENASIYLEQTNYQTQTNVKGEFFIQAKPGTYKILVSKKTYNTFSAVINLSAEKVLINNITLRSENNVLQQVTVKEQRDRELGMIGVQAQNFNLNPNASQNFESLLKQLPGVSTNNELSSQYSVRGGNFDENLIYINNVEIFKPYLVRNGQQEGLSLINPDLAGNVKFSAGGFSAKYGDKLSSVLDIEYKTKDTTTTIASLGTNGLSATTFASFKNFNIALAYRNKNNQSLLKTQDVKGSYKPEFHDFQTLLKYKFSNKLSLDFFGILNTSEFGLIPQSRQTTFGTLTEVLSLNVDYEGQEKDNYKNVVGALTLNYRLKPNVLLKWTNSAFFITEKENFDIKGEYVFEEVDNDYLGGSFGNIKGNRGIGTYQDYGRNELLVDISASDLQVNFKTENSFWETGLRFQQEKIKDKLMEFSYIDSAGYSLPTSVNDFEMYEFRNAKNNLITNRLTGYIVNSSKLSNNISFSGGLRFNYNSFTKEFIPSPRVVFTYSPNKEKDIIYRLSGGLYVQNPFYREMRNFDGSINYNSKSQKSIHIVGASDYNFEGLGTNLKFTTEVYYKHLYDLVPYQLENLRIRYLTDKLSKGYAAGIDFALSGEFIRDLQSSFRLSLLKTEEDIIGDNLGYIKRPTDQRVNFSAFFQDRLFNSPTFKVHTNLLFGSKLPTWPPKSQNLDKNFTIPAYKRLDIGFSKDLLDKESKNKSVFLDKYFTSVILYAEVFNLLNINNTVSYLWISDVNQNRYAIPNYLTSRQLNFKIIAKF